MSKDKFRRVQIRSDEDFVVISNWRRPPHHYLPTDSSIGRLSRLLPHYKWNALRLYDFDGIQCIHFEYDPLREFNHRLSTKELEL